MKIDVGDSGPGEPDTATLLLNSEKLAACTVSITPDTMTVRVTSGNDVIWSSDDCPDALRAQQVVAREDLPAAYQFRWNGQRSAENCQPVDAIPTTGGYWVEAAMIGGEPHRAYFDIKAPSEADHRGRGTGVRRSARGCSTRPGATSPRGRDGRGCRRRRRRSAGRRCWRPAASAGAEVVDQPVHDRAGQPWHLGEQPESTRATALSRLSAPPRPSARATVAMSSSSVELDASTSARHHLGAAACGARSPGSRGRRARARRRHRPPARRAAARATGRRCRARARSPRSRLAIRSTISSRCATEATSRTVTRSSISNADRVPDTSSSRSL